MNTVIGNSQSCVKNINHQYFARSHRVLLYIRTSGTAWTQAMPVVTEWWCNASVARDFVRVGCFCVVYISESNTVIE